jgi:hypothetical protein
MTRGARGLVARLTLVTAVVVFAFWLPVSAGAAGLSGKATGVANKVTSGSWAAVAAMTVTKPYPNAPLTLTFTRNAGNPPASQYFYGINSGSLDLIGATITLSVSPSANTVIEDCTTTWNTSNDTCPGGTIATVLSTATASSTTVTIPDVPSGVFYQLRCRITTAITATTTATIGITVNRTQARAATTTTA